MRRMLIASLLAVAALLLRSSNAAADPAASAPVNSPIVLGYYPCWAKNLSAQDIRWGLFTDIADAFVTTTAGGQLMTETGIPDPNLTALAHQHGVRVLLALGGAGDTSLGAIVRDQAKSGPFIEALATMVKTNGYDGVIVDWEFPDEGDEEALVGFLTGLRTRLKQDNPNALLEEAVTCNDHFGHLFPADRMAPLLDYLQIMSYDMHGPWSDHAGHNSQLYHTSSDPVDGAKFSFADSVEYWTGRGFPKSKILMGIACYGHGFAAPGLGMPVTGKSAYSDLPFNQVQDLIEAGWKVNRDMEADAPYLTDPANTNVISFDDEASARDKGQWTKLQGLPGIFFWEISQDYADGDNPIVRAARTGLGLAP